MPSPVPKFPKIVQNLRERGFNSVGIETLTKEIMYETGIIKTSTLKQTIKAMEILDFIKGEGSTLKFSLCEGIDKNDRPIWPKIKKTETEDELKKFGV